MDRAERRKRRESKIKQREEIIKISGLKQGTVYRIHREKLEEKGPGYMSKHGTLLHYANGTKFTLGKVRKRNSWTGTNNWKARDIKQMNSMDAMEKDM